MHNYDTCVLLLRECIMSRNFTYYATLVFFNYFSYASASENSIVNDMLNDSGFDYSNTKSVYKLTRRLDNVNKKFNLDHQRRLSYVEAIQALNGAVQKASGEHSIYTGGSSGEAINYGHVVPQSFFHNVKVMKSDLHHIYPAHQSINLAREKYRFAVVPDEEADLIYNGSVDGVDDSEIIKNISKYGCKISSTQKKFEPNDESKGRIARACAYFFTRYTWLLPKMSEVIDINTMIEWHEKHPASELEKKREAEIYKVQKNRNPYITQPTSYMREAWLG